MPQSVIVWDSETLPDLQGYTRIHGFAGNSDDEIRGAMGAKFPKPPYHSIVCIGMVVAEWVEGISEVRTVDAPHIGERSERDMIKDFLEQVEDLEP